MAQRNDTISAAKQRSGTEDVGMEYQYNVITYMAAVMSENPVVDNYNISSNLPDIPGFDDLILKVWYKEESHPHVYLGQIKHRASKINFETEKHKLTDYKRDVAKIINSKKSIGFLQDVPNDNIEFLFYSNNTLKKFKSIIIDKEVPYVPLLCNVEHDGRHGSMFPVKVSKNCYKIIPHDHNYVDDEDSLFLSKTRLLLNQSCNRKVTYDIMNIFKEEFSKEMTFAVTRYVREYFRIPTATNITKDLFETELFRIRLFKYIVPPTRAVAVNIEHARIWNRIILDYDVTVVNDSDNILTVLCGCFSQRINDLYNCDFKWNHCIKKSGKLYSEFSVQPFVDRSKAKELRYWLSTPDTIDSLLQEMWKYADMPLVLKIDGDMSILAKYKHLGKKFVVICDVERKYKDIKIMNMNVFARITDVEDTEERSRFLKNIQVSLQGRQPTSLKEIIGEDKTCMEELDCSAVLRLIQKKGAYLDEQTLVNVELMIVIKTITEEEIEECALLAVDSSIHQNVLIACHSANVKAYIALIKDHPKFQNYAFYYLQNSIYGLKFISGDNNKLKRFFIDEDKNPLFYSTSHECFSVIGNTLGRDEEVYISRSLRIPIINLSIFSGKPRIYLLCGNIKSLENTIQTSVVKTINLLVDITLKDDEATFYDVRDNICEKNNLDLNNIKTTYPIVFLKVVEGNLLLLNYKNCTDLNSYISYGENIISEDAFFESSYTNNNITVISGEAGMGKTALLRSLSQAYDGKSFILFCNLTDYTKELKQSKKTKFGLDYIFNKYTETVSCNKKLLHAIYKYHRRQGVVILFIDSFDEVLPVCEEDVLHFIQDVAKTNIKVIIASRTIAKKLLFNQMEIYPLLLADLNVDHVGTYIKDRNLNNIKLQTMPKEFLGNPLYLKFLIFLSEKRKLDFTNIDLVAVYKMVILEKIERYHNKMGLLYDQNMEYLNEEVLEVHRLMAMVAIFGEKLLVSKKIIKNYQKLVNKLNSQKIKLGIVKDFRNGYPVFIHQAIAEFLVAEWLNENLPEEDDAVDIYRKMLTDCDKNIQYILDNMICKDFDLHLAVIKGNLDLVQDLCSRDNIKFYDLDKCGRNALHLASSYCCDEQNYKIMEILLNQMLRDQFDFNTRDLYLKFRWFDYLKFKNPEFFKKACSFDATTLLKMSVSYEKKLISSNDISNALLNGNFHTLLFLFEMNRALLGEQFERVFNISIDRGCTSAACKLIRLHYGNNPRFRIFLNICQKLRPIANGIEFMVEMKISHFTALHIACLYGHGQLIKQLLEFEPAGVTATDHCKRTLLHYAVVQGARDIVSLLLESKEIDVNSKDVNGQTPLHLAVKHSNLNIVPLLLENGAGINDKTYSGETVLTIAAARNMSNMCKILLKHGPNIDERNADGSSSFLIATERGNINVLRLLLNYGADIAQRDCWGNTGLHLACFQGHSNICKMLVRKSRDLMFIKNRSGLTPMEINFIHQNFDIIEILQETEASFDVDEENLLSEEESFDSNEGQTPLDLVKSAEEIQLQFNSLKVNDINVRANNGETPLHVACRCGYVDVVEALLSAQADNAIQNNLGQTALHLAAKNNNVKIVRILLQHSANIDSVDNYLESPLHIAVKNQNINIVHILLERGADVNRQNYDGRSALHMAVKRYETNIAEILLCSGANIYQLDFCNKTTLHIAVEYENEEVIKVLLGVTAALNDYVDIFGNTPLHIAVINQNMNIVKMLIKHGASAFRLNAEGISAIHIAASMQNSTIQNILLQSVANADDFDTCKDAALRIAVLQSDVKMTLAILERGADINYTNDYNESALHVAARQGNIDMINILLDKGADINCVDIFMETPLHIAARYSYMEMLHVLLENGVNINRVNYNGNTALHIGLDNQNEYISELLLKFNANIRYDKTALFLAVKHHNMKLLKMLLKYGLDIKNAQQPALNIAIENGNLNMTRLLLEEGIDSSLVHFSKRSPLHIAVEKLNIKSVKLLLKEGMDINFIDSSKKSALHIAVEKQNVDIVNLLLDNEINLNIGNHLKQSPLHLATSLGNIDIIKVLLKKQIDADLVDYLGKSALHVAVECENINVVNILLENGASVNLVNFRGQSALHGAVEVENLDLVKILLEKDADTNLIDFSGRSALHVAVQKENVNIVSCLLMSGLNLNLQNFAGESVLHCAVEKGNIKIIEILLKAGIDINMMDFSGRSSLYVAIKKNNFNIAQYLLKNGADLNYKMEPVLHMAIGFKNVNIVKLLLENFVDANLRNSFKESALHIAAKTLNVEIMNLVLDCGVDINAVDIYHQSALHFAIVTQKPQRRRMKSFNISKLLRPQPSTSKPFLSERVNCVTLLLGRGININLVDNHGRSALHLAIKHSQDEIVMILLDNEADINLTDNLGNTVLHTAAQYQRVTAIEVILRKTTDINRENNSGRTALHVSVQNQCESSLEMLLEKGANPNSIDNSKLTPLSTATKNCDFVIVKMLLKSGSDVNYVDDQKQSILHHAVESGHTELVELILNNGGDSNQSDINNRTPLDIAGEFGYADIVKLLLQYKKK